MQDWILTVIKDFDWNKKRVLSDSTIIDFLNDKNASTSEQIGILKEFARLSNNESAIQNIDWCLNHCDQANDDFLQLYFQNNTIKHLLQKFTTLTKDEKEQLQLQLSYKKDFSIAIPSKKSTKTIFIKTDSKDLTDVDIDIYLHQLMPINGDNIFFQYDNYLPFHRWLRRYNNDNVCIYSSNYNDTKPYLYVLSFKHFASFIQQKKTSLYKLISDEILRDIRSDKCLLILNDSHEYTKFDFKNWLRILQVFQSIDAPKNIFLLSGNNIQKNQLFQLLKILPKGINPQIIPTRFFEEAVSEWITTFYPEINFTDRFTTFQNNAKSYVYISHNRNLKDFRTALSFFIHRNHLKDFGQISHLGIPEKDSFLNSIFSNQFSGDDYTAFKKSLPWIVDNSFKNIYWNTISKEQYWSSLLYIITETEYEGKVQSSSNYFTEKTYKPIALMMPFIIVAPAFSLEQLRSEGYLTFSKWWDESYDSEKNPVRRMEKITQTIQSICSWNKDKQVETLKEMQPTLEHNLKLLLEERRNHSLFQVILDRYYSLF